MKRRRVVQAILCPLNNEFMTLDACHQCSYHEGTAFVNREQAVQCSYESPREQAMHAPETRRVEPTSRW